MRLVDALRYADVEAAARRILAPADPSAGVEGAGLCLDRAGALRRSLADCRISLERNPGDPEAHNNLGIVLSALMRWDESIKCFSRSIEIKPDDPEVLKNYGVALARMHKYDEAVPYFLKAIECHPGDYVEAIEQLAALCWPAIATMKPGLSQRAVEERPQQRGRFCRNCFAPASSAVTGTSCRRRGC
jgi:tetratricopeptide (TPR) repeat protein